MTHRLNPYATGNQDAEWGTNRSLIRPDPYRRTGCGFELKADKRVNEPERRSAVNQSVCADLCRPFDCDE